jgi:hypothetical protein
VSRWLDQGTYLRVEIQDPLDPQGPAYGFFHAHNHVGVRLVNQSDSPGDGLMMSRSDLTAKPSALIDYHQNPAASPGIEFMLDSSWSASQNKPLSYIHSFKVT